MILAEENAAGVEGGCTSSAVPELSLVTPMLPANILIKMGISLLRLLHLLRANVCPKQIDGKDEFSSFISPFLIKIGVVFLQMN